MSWKKMLEIQKDTLNKKTQFRVILFDLHPQNLFIWMHHYAWKIKILSMKRENLKVTMTLCFLIMASIFQAFLSCLLKISLAMTSMLIRNTHEKLSLFWHVKCLWVLLSYFSYYWQSNRRVCSCGRWVVSVVAWHSSKTAILYWPRFKSC